MSITRDVHHAAASYRSGRARPRGGYSGRGMRRRRQHGEARSGVVLGGGYQVNLNSGFNQRDVTVTWSGPSGSTNWHLMVEAPVGAIDVLGVYGVCADGSETPLAKIVPGRWVQRLAALLLPHLNIPPWLCCAWQGRGRGSTMRPLTTSPCAAARDTQSFARLPARGRNPSCMTLDTGLDGLLRILIRQNRRQQ